MLCNATSHLGDGKRVILHQRVPGSVRAIRAVRNTRVFLTETTVVADVRAHIRAYMAASVPLSAIRSILKNMLRSVPENVLGGVHGNVLGVYFEIS